MGGQIDWVSGNVSACANPISFIDRQLLTERFWGRLGLCSGVKVTRLTTEILLIVLKLDRNIKKILRREALLHQLRRNWYLSLVLANKIFTKLGDYFNSMQFHIWEDHDDKTHSCRCFISILFKIPKSRQKIASSTRLLIRTGFLSVRGFYMTDRTA